MCGIFTAIQTKKSISFLMESFKKIKHRGPDATEFKQVNTNSYFGFHRLAINGLSKKGNQPMYKKGVWLVANAEIFNYKEIANKYNFQLKTGSDCEVIIDLYLKVGIKQALKELNGEFALVLYDESSNEYFAARDHLGIRGMYMGTDDTELFFASEAKALTFCAQLKQFPPHHYWSSKMDKIIAYDEHNFEEIEATEADYLYQIRNKLTHAVKERMMSERPIGCLLSGGLDSSLIAGILAKELHQQGKKLTTFSIGLKGSPDLIAAQKVADYIGSIHHSVTATEEEFLSELEQTVYLLGSYDVTTIRASVGHQLVAKYVRQHTSIKVLFSGETADEMGSYLYFQNAPSPKDFQDEAKRLLRDIQFFDMKRGDRCISNAGLEARVPFAAKDFVEYYMSIPAKYRMFDSTKIEKYLIRQAFADAQIIPDEVLWRRKNGFSDSVSSQNKSWSTIIQEHVDLLISNDEFKRRGNEFDIQPTSKEAYYYMKLFQKNYINHFQLTPYQWLPKWCGEVTDPSARVLSIYQAD